MDRWAKKETMDLKVCLDWRDPLDLKDLRDKLVTFFLFFPFIVIE